MISIAYTVSVANAYINKKPLNTSNNTSLLISLFLLLLLLFIILLRLFGVNKLSANIGPEPDFLFGVPVNTEPAVKVLLLLLLLLFEVLLFVLELLEVELVVLLSSLDFNIDNKFFCFLFFSFACILVSLKKITAIKNPKNGNTHAILILSRISNLVNKAPHKGPSIAIIVWYRQQRILMLV